MALSEWGYKAIRIGYDPKADSTIQPHQGYTVTSILDIIGARGDKAGPDGLVTEKSGDVSCAEIGGPIPGMGCAGHGTITASEAPEERNAFEACKPDVVIYDALGDAVCGGLTMPIREGYTDKVSIVTLGENMTICAAANIATAVESFEARGYAGLGGILLSRRGVERKQEEAEELVEDMETEIIDSLDYSPLVGKAEEFGKAIMGAYPDSDMAGQCRKMADAALAACGEEEVKKAYA